MSVNAGDDKAGGLLVEGTAQGSLLCCRGLSLDTLCPSARIRNRDATAENW